MAEKEYIEREAAYKACEAYFSGVCVYDVSESEVINDFEEVIDAVPTADVVPIRHGRWERNKSIVQCDVCGFGLFPDGYFFENGECTHANEQNFRLNFCPNCGARMDGGEENDH